MSMVKVFAVAFIVIAFLVVANQPLVFGFLL